MVEYYRHDVSDPGITLAEDAAAEEEAPTEAPSA
jgi:hypothetical protein